MSELNLDRLRKLVALSASSQIEEARTAAYMACALIREHNLLDRLERPGVAAGMPPWTSSTGRTWDDIAREAEEEIRARHRSAQAAKPPQPARPGMFRTQFDFDPQLKWVRIHAKHPGTCRVCGKRAEVGANIYWQKGVGLMHHACAPWNVWNASQAPWEREPAHSNL